MGIETYAFVVLRGLVCLIVKIHTGYQSEYKRRTGRKPDGCAVCFKRDRFSLVSCQPVEFYRRGVPLLDRDNVGLVLLLRPRGPAPPSARGLCVANTHLLYNPRRGDIKLAQLALLLAEISRVSRPLGGADDAPCPVILCGDFNSVPWSPLYTFIRDSRLEYEGIPIGKVRVRSPPGGRLGPLVCRLSLSATSPPPQLSLNCSCSNEPTNPLPGYINVPSAWLNILLDLKPFCISFPCPGPQEVLKTTSLSVCTSLMRYCLCLR